MAFIFVLRARKPKSDGLRRIPKCRADVSLRRPQNRGCQDRVADEWLAREAGWAFPYHFAGTRRFPNTEAVASSSKARRKTLSPQTKYLLSRGLGSLHRGPVVRQRLRVFYATPRRNRSKEAVTWAVLRCVGELVG